MTARWRRSFLVQLLVPYLATLVAVVASLYAYTDRVVADLYLETVLQSGLSQARLIGESLPWNEQGKGLDARCAELGSEIGGRITVIAADGTVLGDSTAPSANLQNHGDRPEVRAALREGQGHSRRISASVRQPLLYSAWREHRGDDVRVIRLAIPMDRAQEVRGRMRVAGLVGMAVAALAALWPALAVSRRLRRRASRFAEFTAALGRGENPPALRPEGAGEIGRLETQLVDGVTGLSRQLASARVEQQKLEAALSGMAEGVLVIDDWGTVVFCNRRADEQFATAPGGSLLGRALIEVTRQPEIHQIVRDVMAAGESEKSVVREVTLERPQRKILQITANPLTGPGNVRTYVLVCHDITELKRLQNNQREFVANVSHELRTPLAAIQGYSETLLAGALEDADKARGFLAIIERHAKRLARLVDDLLTLSDLELGRMEMRRRPVAASVVVENACEILQQQVRAGRLTLRKEVPADLPLLEVDADRVVQALLNLVDNAVKYTPPGGSVTVRVGRADPAELQEAPATAAAKEWIEIAVADTGVGVPSQDLPNLTRRFYRVDKARSRELGGTGLGLAIVKHIVQAHGGWMRIDSVLNKGTTVRVYLPACARA